MVVRIESRDRTVIEITVVVALFAVFLVQAAIRGQESIGCPILREAAFDADAVSNVLHRIVSGRLMGDAAMPGRACPLLRIPAQCARRRIISLDVELRIVFDGFARLRIEARRTVQIIDVLSSFDELAGRTIKRIEETIPPEMTDNLTHLAADERVIQHVDANFVIIPGVVRSVLKVPGQLSRIDVQSNDGVGIQVVAGPRLWVVLRNWIACPPEGQPCGRIVGSRLPDAPAARFPCVVFVLPGLAPWIAGSGYHVPAPYLLPCSRLERCNPAARAGVSRSVRNENLVLGSNG